MQNKKVLLWFMVALPFFTEMVSANSPIIALLNPLFLFIQVVSYGAPVVLIREMVIKWNLGLKGLFTLGFAYGFLNEGVFATTFSDTETLLGTAKPENMIGILNPHWIVFVSIWHALFAVIFPILIIQYLYPNKDRWLNGKYTKIFLAIVILESLISLFVGKSPETVFSIIAIIFFVLIAKFQKSKHLNQTGTLSKKPLWLGISFILYIVISIMLAKVLSFIPFLIFEIFGLFLFYFIFKRKNLLYPSSVMLFGIGSYISMGLFTSIIFGLNPIIFIPNLIVSIIIWIFALKVIKKQNSVVDQMETKFIDL